MGKLVSDLVDFTRTHLGPGIPISPRQENLTSLCEQVVHELRTFNPDRVIELRAPASLSAFIDGGRCAQVLSNLIGNALQYGSKESPVTVEVSGTDDDISIAINNREPVIPPDKIASIFDPLVRLSGIEHAPPGESTNMGIGLFTAREIVHAHSGRINVRSHADQTTFTVTIPKKQKGLRCTD